MYPLLALVGGCGLVFAMMGLPCIKFTKEPSPIATLAVGAGCTSLEAIPGGFPAGHVDG